MSRALAERLRVAGSLWLLAGVELNQGARDSVRARCEQAMAIFEEFRDLPWFANVDYTSGELARFEGEHAPVARLAPLAVTPRRPGRGRGRIRMADDFHGPLPDEVLDAFEGSAS